jgi:hypothetical protein
MARSIRIGVFETNSSSEHSFSVSICGYKSLKEYDCDPHRNVYLNEKDIDYLLEKISLDVLEEKVKEREAAGGDKKRITRRKPKYADNDVETGNESFEVWFADEISVTKYYNYDPNSDEPLEEDMYLDEALMDVLDYLPLDLLKKKLEERKK